MNCLNCNKELTGKQTRYCSDKCRMALKRTQPEQAEPEQASPNRLRHYTDQEFTVLMAQADMKAKPLRVPVPGDDDYKGLFR